MSRITISKMKATYFTISPMGDESYSAELKIECEDKTSGKKENLYVYADSQSIGEYRNYYLCRESFLKKLKENDGDFIDSEGNELEYDAIEQYDDISKTKDSEYGKLYKIVDRMLDDLEDAYGNDGEKEKEKYQ